MLYLMTQPEQTTKQIQQLTQQKVKLATKIASEIDFLKPRCIESSLDCQPEIVADILSHVRWAFGQFKSKLEKEGVVIISEEDKECRNGESSSDIDNDKTYPDYRAMQRCLKAFSEKGSPYPKLDIGNIARPGYLLLQKLRDIHTEYEIVIQDLQEYHAVLLELAQIKQDSKIPLNTYHIAEDLLQGIEEIKYMAGVSQKTLEKVCLAPVTRAQIDATDTLRKSIQTSQLALESLQTLIGNLQGNPPQNISIPDDDLDIELAANSTAFLVGYATELDVLQDGSTSQVF